MRLKIQKKKNEQHQESPWEEAGLVRALQPPTCSTTTGAKSPGALPAPLTPSGKLQLMIM